MSDGIRNVINRARAFQKEMDDLGVGRPVKMVQVDAREIEALRTIISLWRAPHDWAEMANELIDLRPYTLNAERDDRLIVAYRQLAALERGDAG